MKSNRGVKSNRVLRLGQQSDTNVFKDTPFAGGDENYYVLLHLAGAYSIGEGILGFLTMKESNALPGICKGFRVAAMDFPWMDSESEIKDSVRAWRAAVQVACVVNVPYMISSILISSLFEVTHVHGCTLWT